MTIENKTINAQITVNTGVTGLVVVEDCTLTGSHAGAVAGGVIGAVAIQRCNISGFENGIVTQGGSTIVKFNFIHDLGNGSVDPHIDGIQSFGGESGLLIEDNWIAADDTSCVFLKNLFGTLTNITVNHNHCTGADSLIRLEGNASGAAVTGISITNNVLGPAVFQIDITEASATVTGNIDLDGNPVP